MSKKPTILIKENAKGKKTPILCEDMAEGKALYRDAYKNPKADCVAVYLLEVTQKRKIVQTISKPVQAKKASVRAK